MTNKDQEEVSVRSYYKERSIFITGATGFLGKVLLQKLLRDCPDIRTIYVLIRTKPARLEKKEVNPEVRLKELLKSSIFEKLHQETPHVFEKVVAISGDVALENLGISDSDKKILCEHVSVVFHLAATVKFNEKLATVIHINAGGTLRVIELAKMMQLSCLVHVSTAYSNADLQDVKIEEVVYPSPCEPKAFLETAAYLEQIGILDSITPTIIDRKPNTYIFSKNMAENLVQREVLESGLPACIVRPSIVSSVYKDPVERAGWVDNLMGLSGFFYALGHGLNYINMSNEDCNMDIIPVEYVVNILILAAWELGTKAPKTITNHSGVKVYNACVDQFNPLPARQMCEFGLEANKKFPFGRILRPVSVKYTDSLFVFTLLNFIAVGLPCFFIDCVCYLRCQRPRMYRQYTNVTTAFKALAYFTTGKFRFSSNNVEILEQKLMSEDRITFDINIRNIDWSKYIQTCLLGLRRYYDKHDDSTLPAARKNATRVKVFYWILLAAIILILVSLVAGIISVIIH